MPQLQEHLDYWDARQATSSLFKGKCRGEAWSVQSEGDNSRVAC